MNVIAKSHDATDGGDRDGLSHRDGDGVGTSDREGWRWIDDEYSVIDTRNQETAMAMPIATLIKSFCFQFDMTIVQKSLIELEWKGQ